MKKLHSLLLTFLFLTAAYLFAWPSANIPYFGAIVIHVFGGGLFLIGLLFFFRSIWRDAAPLARFGWMLLAIGGILGLALIYTGALRRDLPLLYTHIGFCIAGGAFIVSAWAAKRGFLAGGGFAKSALSSAVFLVLGALITAGAWWLRTVPWERSHRIENPSVAPLTMDSEGDGPNGPFFPSSAQVQNNEQIPANYFIESDSCKRCHEDIYKQWQSSAHHFSSFNNAWYRKSIEYMQDTIGVKSSKWCAGCHDHAVFFNGRFDRPFPNRSTRRKRRRAWDACHAMPLFTWEAPWATPISPWNTLRCTNWLPAATGPSARLLRF